MSRPGESYRRFSATDWVFWHMGAPLATSAVGCGTRQLGAGGQQGRMSQGRQFAQPEELIDPSSYYFSSLCRLRSSPFWCRPSG